MRRLLSDILSNHFHIGPITVYGRNAMHFGVDIKSPKYGYICFRLPFRCFNRWWPLYLYCSPNATPDASTYMIGRKHDIHSWAQSRLRYLKFGHNFDTASNHKELERINNL
jgi:hypothetical protein